MLSPHQWKYPCQQLWAWTWHPYLYLKLLGCTHDLKNPALAMLIPKAQYDLQPLLVILPKRLIKHQESLIWINLLPVNILTYKLWLVRLKLLIILYNYLLGHESRCSEGVLHASSGKKKKTNLPSGNNLVRKSHNSLTEGPKKVLGFQLQLEWLLIVTVSVTECTLKARSWDEQLQALPYLSLKMVLRKFILISHDEKTEVWKSGVVGRRSWLMRWGTGWELRPPSEMADSRHSGPSETQINSAHSVFVKTFK